MLVVSTPEKGKADSDGTPETLLICGDKRKKKTKMELRRMIQLLLVTSKFLVHLKVMYQGMILIS